MPKYYCDYCDAFLTHDSPSVRKTHNGGRKHKENVRMYYQAWMEQQAQKLVDATTKAFTQGRMIHGPPMPGLPGMPRASPFMAFPPRPPGLPFIPIPGIPGMPPQLPGMPPMGLPPMLAGRLRLPPMMPPQPQPSMENGTNNGMIPGGGGGGHPSATTNA